MSLPIYDSQTARQTVLRRRPPDETDLPPAVQERLTGLFGEPLSAEQAVARIVADVRRRGDDALRDWTRKLDGADLAAGLQIDPHDCQSALQALPGELRSALETAAERIRRFHRRQPALSWIEQDADGTLGQLIRPIERVGVYVPGGSAPLPSSVLMSVIPARVAGVQRVIVCTPPGRDGRVNPVILAACALAEVDAVYRVGGAQAIAAMAFGTPALPAVDKIVGAGGLFVTLAKRQVFGVVGIEGLAGPTETVVIADEGASPRRVAADLLAQAEHDPLATALLLTPSRALAEAAAAQVDELLSQSTADPLGRADIIRASLAARGGAVLTRDLDEAIELCNAYAPEHLNLVVRDGWAWLPKIHNAGGVFLDEESCEVMGDYIAGPSHVMPTGGSARYASPLNVWDFVKIVSLVGLNRAAVQRLSPLAETLALAEGLDAHALAARLRKG
jgi:histidinol dehydrogenase